MAEGGAIRLGKMTGFFDEGDLVGVLTTQPLGRVLDYKAPEGGCFAGAFVEVPLGPRKVLGVVWGSGKGDWDIAKVRSVIRVLDVPPMREEMVEFLTKAGAYTLTPMPAMLRLATRSPGLGDPPHQGQNQPGAGRSQSRPLGSRDPAWLRGKSLPVYGIRQEIILR